LKACGVVTGAAGKRNPFIGETGLSIAPVAFSSEGDAGSHKENASNQKLEPV
jgi:hypothetical protein